MKELANDKYIKELGPQEMEAKYLVYLCKGIESVFDSQVLELIKSLYERKIFEKVILIIGINSYHDQDEILQRKIPKEIGVITYKYFPNYPFFNPILRRELKKIIRKNRKILENSVIHVRGELLAYHLSKILPRSYQNKIIPDIRGASIEEIQENEKFSLVQKYLKIWNNKRALEHLNKFKIVTAVSEALKKHLIFNYNVTQEKIEVTPDLAGKFFLFNKNLRDSTRRELNLKDNDMLVLFSNGSTSKWQSWQDTEILTILADKGIKILNLSRYAINHINVINMFVKYNDVPAYLNAADAAIIWGKRRIVTEVRSPVKFSEYICCGLPVIANDSVNMIKDYINNTSFGFLVNDINEVDNEKLCLLRNISRTEIASYARKWLGTEIITDDYVKMYTLLYK